MTPRPLLLDLYRLLLRLLPRSFRAASGDDMQALAFDLYRNRRTSRGRWAAQAFLLRTCLEVFPLAVSVRLDRPRSALPQRRRKTMYDRLDMLSTSLKLAGRGLRREPGYAIAFVLTLCLGIGVNTAIFSLVNGVLLRPLPYPEADRLLFLTQPAGDGTTRTALLSLQEVGDLRTRTTSLDQVVEFGDIGFIVQAGGQAHRATGGLVSPNFFEFLGMRPELGRTLRAGDFGPEARPVAVLTHEYWRRALGADPGVIGEMLDLTDERAEVVGVLQPGAHYAGSTGSQDFYLNYSADEHYRSAAMQDGRTHRMTTVLARLAPGASVQTANAELEQITDAFVTSFPDDYQNDWGDDLRLTPWKEHSTKAALPALYLLLGTAGFVLLAACANVANLMLMRLSRRRDEIAVRAALGAGRVRLRGLLLGESLLLTLTGALAGLLVATTAIDVLVPYISRFTYRTGEIGVDLRVLGFTLAISFAAATLFALLPRLGTAPESRAASTGARSTVEDDRRTANRALVVLQVAVSFVLLVGAGLMIRTLINLYAVDPGFDRDNVLRVDATKFAWRTNRAAGSEERRRFTDELVAELSRHPMIESVAVAGAAPLQGGAPRPQSFVLEGSEEEPLDAVATFMPMVSGGYFDTLGIELLRGRTFDSLVDRPDAQRVAIIDAGMARHYFGSADPVGRRLGIPGASQPTWYTIVGVVADSRITGLEAGGVHTLYRAESQNRSPFTILVRTRSAPEQIAAHTIDVIRRLDPERAIESVESLAAVHADYVAPNRLNARLFGLLAALALAIAAVGIAGTLAFSVAQRRSEIGIRMALGAGRPDVLGMMLREAGGLTAFGLLIGLLGAQALSRFASGFLFGVEPLDPVTYVATAIFVMAIGLAACWIPSRRALEVEPVEALRGS